MVNLTIIVEGGKPADTTNNTESLRQSLHKFFEKVLRREDIAITVYMGTGYRAAVKRYTQGDASECLYIDSDCAKAKLSTWYDRLINREYPDKTIVISEERKEYVFFMIQEMEAWFLKQPESLECWAQKEKYIRNHPDESIAEHSLIRNKDIESISKPSEKLTILLRRYFEKSLPNGTSKAAKYGKLKTAPYLLDALDTKALISLDDELQRFANKMQNLT
jgi:hypothetical protein